MRRLIDDLLSLSKIELNEHVPPSERVDLVGVAKEVVDLVTPVASGQNVKLVLKLEEQEAWVVGDRFQLLQVAQNLVDNAVKYSPPGGTVDIEIATAPSREDAAARAGRRWEGDASRISLVAAPPADVPGYAILRVVDRGPGIARRHLPRLSERFFRVEREETADQTGTGLGLAIVKHIIARHRGGFIVESEVGRGSAFAVFIEQPTDAPHEADA
jgi:two-component system phosphate regulon sensor histidine kinase PhoR